ncbi:MAG: phosphate acetyltransferase [Nanoarchaeota archaeon]|nr:phosphate acetyltransferase [Nanoarchaeota archaeon]
MAILAKIHKKATKRPMRIVYPEATEPRTLHAVYEVVKQKIAYPVLVGDPKEIEKAIKKIEPRLDKSKLTIIDNTRWPLRKRYAKRIYELRKHKGMTQQQAMKLLDEPIYFGTMMVKMGDADGLISGAVHSTAHTLMPALQIIKTHKKFHRVSGIFIMECRNKTYLFADCAVNIYPDQKTLADIAMDSSKTATELGMKPRIAMLSFSTKGSAHHPSVDTVVKATRTVKKKMPRLVIDGELQVDAAIVPIVGRLKAPNSPIKGDANILIFPNLAAGNIAYKLVQRLGNAKAIGPIIQGLAKPVNDLSRGCSIQDIIDITAVTVVQAQDIAK